MFKLERETHYPLLDTYRGPTTVASFEFGAVLPKPLDVIEFTMNRTLPRLPLIGDKLLGWTLSRDTSPRIDRYRVEVILAGEPERETSGRYPAAIQYPSSGYLASPQVVIVIPVVIAVAVALAILAIGGVVAWRLARGDDIGDILGTNTLVVFGGVALLALGILMLSRKG